jgi:serine/threonine-protein kinase
MGEVVLVEDQDIERKVAIKRIHAEQRTTDSLQRFAEEVRIIGQLEHPNITPVHDVGVDEEGRHYFIMKYVEGDTLETIIRKLRAKDATATARFSHDARVDLFLGILNAAAYAHARGILHRDLKPANIMVGPYGEVTVMDWGIAKRIGAAEPEEQQDARVRTLAGALIGTPLYMSPEQAAGQLATLDVRSDIFSLSLIFLELMTLKHPLEDLATTQLVIARLISENFENTNFKRQFSDAGAPLEYGEIVRRGLARDRDRRFSSVVEMTDAIHQLRAGRIPVTCPVTFGRRAAAETMRWINGHQLLYMVALFGGLIGASWLITVAILRLLRGS